MYVLIQNHSSDYINVYLCYMPIVIDLPLNGQISS